MTALPAVVPATLPTRPSMPTEGDNVRSLKQSARYAIMTEDFEELLKQWMGTRVDPQRLAAWGPPDTSSNVLSDMCRQFSTPGLYGSRPDVFHADPTNQALVGPNGHMDRAGYWTMMQWVQYLAIGMGDWLVRADADSAGLSFRLVAPQDVWIYSDQDRPDRPIVLWELRLRFLKLPGDSEGAWVYAWDQYDVGEKDAAGVHTREPSYRVVRCSDDLDVSNYFLGPVALSGEAYPYRDEVGAPFLPFPIYRAVDSKQAWNHLHKVGATRGTLNAATHWTYAGHAARDASGKVVMCVGLAPIAGDSQNVGDPSMIRSVQLSPGSILYHAALPEATQVMIQEVGPGGNLDEVAAFAHGYEARQLARWGISADDVQKSSADPASGAALFISRQSKREYASQVKPLFERADLEAIRICAALLRLAVVDVFAETGYSISYAEIPKSPQEEAAERDNLDWDITHGHASELDAYRRRHPGTRDEDAVAALTKAAVDKASLAKSITDALAAAGLTPAVDADKGGPVLVLTPSDLAGIATVDQALASVGLPPMGGGEGSLTVAEFQAKNAAVIAAAANAAAGDSTSPPAEEATP